MILRTAPFAPPWTPDPATYVTARPTDPGDDRPKKLMPYGDMLMSAPREQARLEGMRLTLDRCIV